MRYITKRRLLHIFFPTRCPVCGALIGAMDRFCGDCTAKLSSYKGGFSIEGAVSFTAAFDYDDSIKPAIILLKDGTDGNAAYALGGALADRLRADGAAEGADMIVPVPMYRRDTFRRGFNQSALIAREVGRELGIAVEEKAVRKIKSTKAQKELNKLARAQNLRGAFAADKDKVRGKHILLIDDICTTGSTLRELTAELLGSGAASVSCACCCKTVSRK